MLDLRTMPEVRQVKAISLVDGSHNPVGKIIGYYTPCLRRCNAQLDIADQRFHAAADLTGSAPEKIMFGGYTGCTFPEGGDELFFLAIERAVGRYEKSLFELKDGDEAEESIENYKGEYKKYLEFMKYITSDRPSATFINWMAARGYKAIYTLV